MPQSLDIGQNLDGGVFDFLISDQSLINVNGHNSSDDTDMKLGPVTKLDKRNKATSKIDNDVISTNCDIVVIFPIYGKFGAIKTHSLKIAFSLKVSFCLTKTENRSKRSLTQLSHYCFD